MTALVRAELLKIRTTRTWWALLVGAFVLSALGVVGTALAAGSARGGPGGPVPGLSDPATVRTVYAAGFGGTYLFTLILGIIGMNGEYRHQTASVTFLATPTRLPVVGAKLIAYAVAGLGYAIVCTAFAVVLGASLIAFRGFPTRLTSDQVPQTLGLVVLAVAVWAIVGVGVGTLLRNQLAAVLTAVGAVLVVEPLGTLLLNHYHLGDVARFLPSSASSAIVQGISRGQQLLPWWGGALTLVGWGALFALIGVLLTLRRDVT